MSISTDGATLRVLLPVLERYYVNGLHEGVCLVAGPEWEEAPGPFPMRSFEEYSVDPPGGVEWRVAAARRCLLEERPDLLVTVASDTQWAPLADLVEALGVHWRRCAEGAGSEWPEVFVREAVPVANLPRFEGGILSRAADPAFRLREMLGERSCWEFAEPVNLAYQGSECRFGYADYDNEFALAAPTHDLRAVLRSVLRDDQFQVNVSPWRPGTAGASEYLEACDGRIPCFQVKIDMGGLPPRHWTDRFKAGAEAEMKLLLIDLHNVAGQGMQHSMAINRFSRSSAHVLCHEPHPFIESAGADCKVVYTKPGWTDEILQLVREADVLAFFEEDDVDTVGWPESFKEVARTKASLHFYVGQRVHKGVAGRQRPGKMVIAALPHILKMYPNSQFFAGFYPPRLEEMVLRPPLSEKDGILRVLHTPSLPHPTLHRFLYHKDTGGFLEAAQVLKERYPTVSFLQLAGVPHGKVLEARQDCDIAFHQLRGFMGMTGNEAMFLRRPCIQAFDRININRHLEYWGLDCVFPWLHADRATLVDVLEKLITDADYRAQVGQDGRFFMLQNHNVEVGIVVYLYYALQALSL